MPISSALKVRNKSIRATYATITGGSVHCKKNIPVTPFTPITGLNGKPFVDSTTGDLYYEYYVDPTGNPLPAGLVLNSRTGQVTGTSTVSTVVSATSFSVDCKFAVRDSRMRRAYKESTVSFIITETLTATPPVNNKIVGVVNQVDTEVSIFATITGGRPPYVYTVTQGVLPADVEIDQTTGKLKCKPSETKRTFTDPSQTDVLPITSAVLIEAQDFYGETVTSSFDFDIINSIIATPRMDAVDPSKNFVIKGVIPLAVNYTSFTSVVAGTPPYTYITSTKQKDSYPTGVSLNATTGVVSGTYNGTTEYTGTLQISVTDSTGALAANIAKVDIKAYLPFIVEAADTVNGAPSTSYEKIEFKDIDIKPLKGKYGEPPYTFSIVSCKYTSKTNVVTNTTTLPTGLTLTASDSSLKSTTGLATGTYEITFNVVDSANTVATSVPKVTLTVSDAVAANSLITTKSYEMYVGDATSALTTGFHVMEAILGIPPYTFKVEPALPSGLIMTTLPTKCFINGIPSVPVDETYVFSVKDSTGAEAKYTESIHLKIVAHLTSSANVTDIEAFIDDLVEPIDIFDSITGGYPPYTVKLLTGTLRSELSIVTMGFKYYDTSAGKDITVDTPKLWGNLLIAGAGTGTPILGQSNVYGYVSQDTYTFSVSDAKGEVSPNIATLNYNIFKQIKGVPTRVPPVVTGIAEYTNISFKPITPIDGVPPYVLSVTKSITDRSKKPAVKKTLPSLGLKPIQPDTISGTPNAGYSGVLYYYLTDKTGGRTDNIPVRFEITPKINAVKFEKMIEVLHVKGYPKYEITDKNSVGAPTVTLVDDLKYPIFKSVTGGATPYVYYETDDTGKSVATSKLPYGYYIDTFGNIASSGVAPTSFTTTSLYCAVADSNLVRAEVIGGIKLSINDVFTTELVDNVTDNTIAATSFNNTKSNTLVTKLTDGMFTAFKLVKGKNGSGRYSYMFDLTTVSPTPVLNYFQINGSTGEIGLKPLPNGTIPTKFTDIIDAKFGIKVTDTFTQQSIVVSNVMQLVTVAPMTMVAISANVGYEKDSAHSNDPVFTITGGSGLYDFVSSEPTLPSPLQFTSTDGANAAGGITGAASSTLAETPIKVTYRDRVYGNTVNKTIQFSITSGSIVVPVEPNALAKPVTINLATIQTISKMTASQLLNTPVKIRIEVNKNVSSADVTKPALTVNIPTGLHEDTTIKLITKTGSVVGCGGRGGSPSTSAAIANGQNGGPALKIDTGPIVVDVECTPGTYIAGGGGGGGASGGSWRYYKGPQVNMYKSVAYETGSIQVWDASIPGWRSFYPIKSDTSLWRATYILDYKYKDLKNETNFLIYGRNVSLDFTTPDPAPITGYRYIYQASTTLYWLKDFTNPTGFQLQTDIPYCNATVAGSWGYGGNGFGFGGILMSTAGSNGNKDLKNATLPLSPLLDKEAGVSKITLTDPSTVVAERIRFSSTTPTEVTKTSLEYIGIKHGSIYVRDGMVYPLGIPSTPGTGINSSTGGSNLDETTITNRYNWMPYYGAGGGGGAGGEGGDGGKVDAAPPSDAPSINLLVGGVGGVPGPAIVTATTTPLPTLVTPSLVYGDVL